MKRFFLTMSVVFAMATISTAQIEECGTSDALIAKYDTDKRKVPDHGKTFQIPVMVHVLYNNKTENIPDAQIQEMLDSLQEDFLGLNTDYSDVPQTFTSKAAIPRIRFVRADTLPDGKPTTGIIRTPTKVKRYTGKHEHEMFAESHIIAPSEYLNIYVCDYEDNGLTVSGNKKKDGIVVRYKVANGESRTASHETGHWLNLRHVWAGGGKKKCGDDGLKDTPKSKKHYTGRTYRHPRKECRSQPVMFMNYMDYGAEHIFFTRDQVDKMRQKILKQKPNVRTID